MIWGLLPWLFTADCGPITDGITDNQDEALLLFSKLYSNLYRNALNYITEELKDPYVNLPRAIVLGLSLVTCLYLAVNVAYLSVLSPDQLIHSDAVAVVFKFVYIFFFNQLA